jgi:hypothetical protein
LAATGSPVYEVRDDPHDQRQPVQRSDGSGHRRGRGVKLFRRSPPPAEPAPALAPAPAFDLERFTREIAQAAALIASPEATPREAALPKLKGKWEEANRQEDLLHRLAAKYKPSKRYHNYIERYSLHFAPVRERVRKVVEIGVQTPASLLMWEEYFPAATVYGIDIDEACRGFAGGRKEVWIGDQKDEAFLQAFVAGTGGGFDIVIDDGEHSETAILKSFCWLFPALGDHGIYAVEDIIEMPNVARFFRAIERSIGYWPPGFETVDWPYLHKFDDGAPWLARNVVGLHFYRYLCIVNRGFNPQDNPYLHVERNPDWPGTHNAAWMAQHRRSRGE